MHIITNCQASITIIMIVTISSVDSVIYSFVVSDCSSLFDELGGLATLMKSNEVTILPSCGENFMV
jgi:hypothetical protein